MAHAGEVDPTGIRRARRHLVLRAIWILLRAGDENGRRGDLLQQIPRVGAHVASTVSVNCSGFVLKDSSRSQPGSVGCSPRSTSSTRSAIPRARSTCIVGRWAYPPSGDGSVVDIELRPCMSGT